MQSAVKITPRVIIPYSTAATREDYKVAANVRHTFNRSRSFLQLTGCNELVSLLAINDSLRQALHALGAFPTVRSRY